MASSNHRIGKRTPRSSPTRNRDVSAQDTPDNTLHKLADAVGNPTTPGQYGEIAPQSAPTPNRPSSRRTPSAGVVAVSSNVNIGGNSIPATPHTVRALQRRAATYTPGRDRRKSGRIQRETPLDILRNLGKALAPTSHPIRSSPQEELEPQRDGIDDLDQEPDPPKPRLSLPLGDSMGEEDEDGSPDIPPPRLSLPFGDDDVTQRSIELPRRDRSTRDLTMLSRGSFGSVRFSDRFGDISRIDGTEEGVDFTVVQEDDEEEQMDITAGQSMFDPGGETEDLRRFNLEFSFPTPDTTGLGVRENATDEDFVLDAIDPQVNLGLPSSDNIAGGEGFELAMQARSPERDLDPGILQTGNAKSRKRQRLSRHGIPLPSLPSGVVKRLAIRFTGTGRDGKTKVDKETLAAVEKATEWFFEQASEDLGAYSKHAGRKTIDETDVITLMRRQRHIGKSVTVFSLAQKHLPKELLQDMRLAKPR